MNELSFFLVAHHRGFEGLEKQIRRCVAEGSALVVLRPRKSNIRAFCQNLMSISQYCLNQQQPV
jgi:hypothetical protein